MTDYILNEWFWEDICGNNTLSDQQKVVRFLNLLLTTTDRIVIIIGSKFDKKAWYACREEQHGVGKSFLLGIRQDLSRCKLLKESEVPIFPDELKNKVKDDDYYLVQAALAVPNSIIVTTDNPLITSMRETGIPCIHRDELYNQFTIN